MGNSVHVNNDLVIQELRRILDEEEGTNGEVVEEESEESESEEEEYVPIVSEDCADTDGLIEVSDNESLNCRKIKKSKLCDRKHNGHHLYESCEESCGICVEIIPTTDAPTADLLELVITDMPIDSYKSMYPS